jgi:hypothetical protein
MQSFEAKRTQSAKRNDCARLSRCGADARAPRIHEEDTPAHENPIEVSRSRRDFFLTPRLFFLTPDALGFIQRLTMKPTVQLRRDVRPQAQPCGRAHSGALGRSWQATVGGSSVAIHRAPTRPATPKTERPSFAACGMQLENLSDFGDFGYSIVEVIPF